MNRKTRNIVATLALAVGLMLFSTPAQANIFYVDAVDGSAGNTYATGGSLADTSWNQTGTTANGTDDWRKRSTFGNGGVIYEGGYTGVNDPELTTEVTGLTAGVYDVWAFFWDATGSNTWTLAAGLTSGSLSVYSFDGPGDTASPVAASTLTFANAPMLTDSDRILYGVKLGQQTVTTGGTLDVFVGNGPLGPNTRTWYDGVGYEVVSIIPEPASLAMALIGLPMLAARRRR